MEQAMKRTTFVLVVLASLAFSTAAAAQGKWTITQFGGSVDAGTVATFTQLLKTELSSRTGDGFSSVDQVCEDVPCAQAAGAAAKGSVVLYGNLGTLGTKIVVTVTLVDVASGDVINTQRMAVDQLEDLDSVAERMAEAFVRGTSTDETAELGNITKEEAKPARRRDAEHGLGLRLGGIVPLGEAGFADQGGGVAVDLSYWYEASNFAIAPRLGFRFSADPDDENSFFELPFDIGAYYILGQSDFAPFIGGGAGLRYMSQRVEETQQVGGIIATTHNATVSDSAFGFGTFGRVGILLGRTYTVRVAVTADYNIAFLELNGESNPQSFTAGVSVFF
jgi:hypothetical protein